MATLVPFTNRFHTTTEQVPTNNLGSAQANSGRETYSMQDIIDTTSKIISTFPSFTTDLDTEIEVAPIIIAGVSTQLYYKRYLVNAVGGVAGPITAIEAGIPTIVKTNMIIESEIAPGIWTPTTLFTGELFYYGEIFYEALKNVTILSIHPKTFGDTFSANYRVTFEIWYT
tara:strand:- start:414 stop:926 length:513 start_codon:yes stop_codon:yes gene_type:complete